MLTTSHQGKVIKITIYLVGLFLILIGFGILLGKLTSENLTGPIMLFSFAFACISVIIWSKKNWWVLIPTGIFLAAGAAATTDILLPESKASGPIFFFIFGLSFLIIFFLSKKNLWSVLISGVLWSLCMVTILNNYLPQSDFQLIPGSLKIGAYTWVLVLGIAITFAVLWFLRKNQSAR